VKHELRISGLKDKVMFTGWVPHEELPKYLNDIKLYVLPSYSEGLPKATLEAMACGTPVLVTPVGGIPDVIKDGKTGFITEDNSSECIARNIIRALSHPNLDQSARMGQLLLKRNTGTTR